MNKILVIVFLGLVVICFWLFKGFEILLSPETPFNHKIFLSFASLFFVFCLIPVIKVILKLWKK